MRRAARGVIALAARLLVAWPALILGLVAAMPASAQDAVCAQVKIEIKQKLSLERQAFDAVMRINNGLDSAAIQGVGVNLTFQDDAGNAVVATTDSSSTTATFFLRVDELSGIDAIDGTGVVAPKTTGEIRWLIIPAQGAGGTQPQGKLYYVGASLTYTVLGTTSTVAVTPDFITVKPQPLLTLDYFLAGDVYADDPFTAPVEPAEPFTLGVRIKNVGGGTAAKTSIESAQPKIVENTQGLLLGFQILDSYVNDAPAAKTLLLNFGDIGAGRSMVGRWSMVTTLSGKFIDLTAGYTHADSLGGALTSLIQGVNTHLLVHDVRADLPGRDTVRDFLALDGDVLRLYESEGTDTAVIDQSANARLAPASSGGGYDLSFPPTTGFAYARLVDPFGGRAQPEAVVRSDGKVIPAENVWLSKTRNASLVWTYYVNFFDVNTSGVYSVRFSGGTYASIAGVVYADGNDNGVKDAGENGLGVTAVTLTGTDDQGTAVAQTAYAAADGSWSFIQRPGTYSLKVGSVSGYVDGKSKVGTAGGTLAGDTVTGIVLAAGAQATGYLFAKATPPPVPVQADVGIAMTANATTVPVGSNVTFTLTASNAGPAVATDTKVTDLLPAQVTLVSAAPTVGTYDAGSGVWTIGTLASATTAKLILVAKVNSTAQPAVNTATVRSALVDPVGSNNSASVTINPEAGTLNVLQTIPREARVLAFVGCAGTTAAANLACTTARATFLSSYLTAGGYDANVVTSVDAFVSALRSGRYNTFWLNADDNLSLLALGEVREAVLRGGTLIFDGPNRNILTPLDDVAGARTQLRNVGTGLAIDLVGGGRVATVGDDRKLALDGGTIRATFATTAKDPAIVAQSFGDGYGLVVAFDLVGTLQVPASEIALRGMVTELLTTRAPAVPTAFVGNAYVPVVTEVDNLTTEAVTVDVTATLAAGLAVSDTNPAPTSTSGNTVSWRLTVPAKGKQYIDLGVRTPLASGSYAVQTAVAKVVGSTVTPYSSQSLTIPVAGSEQFGAQLIADLDNLSLPLLQRVARELAVLALKDARNAIAANDFERAFPSFIIASEAIATISKVPPMPYRIVTAKWLQEAEQRWYFSLPVCGATVPQVFGGSSFNAFDSDEGLKVRGGRTSKGADWAWSLGSDREVTAKSVQQGLDWVSGKTYGFTLSYDGLGGGTYTVTDAQNPLFSRTYARPQKLRAGDTLKLTIGAEALAASGRIDASVSSVNGKPLSATLGAVGSNPGNLSTYVYYPPMASSFQLAGTVKLTFPLASALLEDRLDLTVTAGNSLCRTRP